MIEFVPEFDTLIGAGIGGPRTSRDPGVGPRLVISGEEAGDFPDISDNDARVAKMPISRNLTISSLRGTESAGTWGFYKNK